MKKRDGNAEAGAGGGGGSEYKKKRRLGGKGLSLDKFVGANRVQPVVTASQIRKQREAYQNSKKVNKYRKTLKHLAEEGHEFRPRVPLSTDAEIPGSEEASPRSKKEKEEDKEAPSTEPAERGKKGKKAKPVSHLEKLREEYERKRHEEEEIKREKRALFEEQQAAREKASKERKEVQKKFRKTTGKGQPVMKHRMEHLLESIQRDMKS